MKARVLHPTQFWEDIPRDLIDRNDAKVSTTALAVAHCLKGLGNGTKSIVTVENLNEVRRQPWNLFPNQVPSVLLKSAHVLSRKRPS